MIDGVGGASDKLVVVVPVPVGAEVGVGLVRVLLVGFDADAGFD